MTTWNSEELQKFKQDFTHFFTVVIQEKIYEVMENINFGGD